MTNTSIRDFADKSYLSASVARSSSESTFEKVAAVMGLVFMLIAVGGMLVVSAIPSVPH